MPLFGPEQPVHRKEVPVCYKHLGEMRWVMQEDCASEMSYISNRTKVYRGEDYKEGINDFGERCRYFTILGRTLWYSILLSMSKP